MQTFPEHTPLFTLQNEVLARLQSTADPQVSLAKLCGGTALARKKLPPRTPLICPPL